VTNELIVIEPLRPTDAVDLHMHTLASDGFWTPEALIDHLAGGGFKVAAVCDHDTQRSVLDAMRLGAERGIRVIPGVEVTTNWSGRQWHLLVYGIAPDQTGPEVAPFQAVLAEQDATLQARAEDARQRLEASGRPLPSLPEILDGRPMWPFHVLSAAIKEGHVKNLTEAATLVTELGGSFTADVPLGRVIDAAHAGGGICVMAHPGRSDSVGIMTEDDLKRMLAEFPLDGLEAHYRSYTDEQTALYRDMADRYGLLISCGSDSHAPNMPVNPRPWRAAWCRDLLERLGVEVERSLEPVWQPVQDPLAAKPPAPDANGKTPAEEPATTAATS
jgi:predicted metal-dependent phosphoesterase TrpH